MAHVAGAAKRPAERSDDVTRPAPGREPAQVNSRSCVTCRHRKVRCGRSNPCSNCVKAGIDCVFPTARRESRKAPDAELVARLKGLESALGRLVNDHPGGQQGHDPPSAAHGYSDGCHWNSSPTDGNSSARCSEPVGKNLGRFLVNEGQTQYVSESFWANTCDEVTEIGDALSTPTPQDIMETPSRAATPPNDSSTIHQELFLGHIQPADSLRALHPSQSQSFIFMLIFEENCDPVVKITHRPTVRKMFLKAASGIECLSRAEEALLFSIYYGAVCSLTEKQCQDQLGEDREKLAGRFRGAVEHALARANFLTTPSVMAMQAFVLFLMFLRSHDDMRLVRSLSGLAIHLARSLGVHRDGTNFGLSSFATEMRRRLWWHVSLLDSRSTEDHGAEPAFTEAFYDARLPLNINDEDISPETRDMPKERIGTTEMTFCLIRFELSQIMRQMNFTFPDSRRGASKLQGKPLAVTERWIEEIRQRIEEKYLQHCDTMVPYEVSHFQTALRLLMRYRIYWASATVGRLVLSKLCLIGYHPLQHSKGDAQGTFTQDVRDRLFTTSVELIERGFLLESHERTAKWRWLFRTYMQWHAMSFVLSELCSNPLRADHEQAWRTVEPYYEMRVLNCPTNQKGMFWRPLQQLMRRAQVSREASRRETGLPVDPRMQRDSSTQLSAGLESTAFDKFPDMTLPVPLVPALTSTQNRQPPSEGTAVQRSRTEAMLASFGGQGWFSRADAEGFGWPGSAQGALDMGDVQFMTQDGNFLLPIDGFEEW